MNEQKLTFWDLSKMAGKALAKERKCIEDNDLKNALRYSDIWYRIMKAMANPNYFFDNSKSELEAA